MKRLNEVIQGKEENYMLPFFWQHGEDEATLRKYMHVIHDANIGAVCIESRPHPDFCGEKWWTDMDIILEEAEKLGMKVWILDDSHFPTGFANGAVKKAPGELHHQYLVYRILEMAGPVKAASFSIKEYMQPAPLPPWIPVPPKSDDPFDDDQLIKIYACEILEGEVLGTPLSMPVYPLSPDPADVIKAMEESHLHDMFTEIHVLPPIGAENIPFTIF